LDAERYHNQRMRILARLQQGPAISLDLAKISLRYSSRIHELRRLGFHIDVKRTAACGYRYTLNGKPINTHREREPAWITEGAKNAKRRKR
jgi:hypothetical protein